MMPTTTSAARLAATDQRTRRRGRVERVGIASVGVIQADAAELGRLRSNPGLDSDPRALRHANEQTVLTVAAVCQAAASTALGPFEDWGVIAAPRWQGRSGTATAIERFHAVGVRGVGPNAIPNLCLHAGAAAVSLCLTAHGPVYGAGGGPFHVTDGLLAALAAQLGRDTPGTWLVCTEWDGDETAGQGRAIALALVPLKHPSARWTLSMRPGAPGPATEEPDTKGSEPARLAGLGDFFAAPSGTRWDCPFDGGEFSLTTGDEP